MDYYLPAGINRENGLFLWTDQAYGMSNENNMRIWVNATLTSIASNGFKFSNDALILKDYFTLSDS